VTAPAPPSRGFDPEAEQEVDFARYVRLLAVRWWLLAAGLVSGAVIGAGATRRLSAVRWGVAGNIVFAWLLTIPAAGLVAAALYWPVEGLF